MSRTHAASGSSAQESRGASPALAESLVGHRRLPRLHHRATQCRLAGQVARYAPRYDGTPDPAEFLQLYELSIEAANGGEKVMANWFPMALKDGARSWLVNLPLGSISSWHEMRDHFVANFQGTRDRPPVVGDLRRIKQQPRETLQKYI